MSTTLALLATPEFVATILNRAGILLRRGEAADIAAGLAADGHRTASPEEVIRRHKALRASAEDDHRSLAITLAGYGITAEPKELKTILRRLAQLGRPPLEDEAISALVGVRRPAFSERIFNLAAREKVFRATAQDARAAAALIHTPAPSTEDLLAAYRIAVTTRLRAGHDTPEAAVIAAIEDLLDIQGAAHPSPQRAWDIAYAISEVYGLESAAAARLCASARSRAEEAEQAAQEAATLAQARLAQDQDANRTWETSLVTFEAVPAILGCNPEEAKAWLKRGLIPVAAWRPASANPDNRITALFDPKILTSLSQVVPSWRHPPADKPATPSIPSHGGQTLNAAIAEIAGLDRYASHFKTARSIQRRIILITGPTNSGKSHQALDRLAQAPSGTALAPLRLLAHEFREALADRGVKASLVTGEEQIIEPSSRHRAATVEMASFHTPLDVAIIDEAQMSFDRDRGAAWTAAIMGAPARDVYVLGAPDCRTVVQRMAELCQDPVEEIRLERKSPLHVASETLLPRQLKAGDALVAFSRRQVLEIRDELITQGHTVAVVYGALSPEVRRAEAARFRNGEASILVATDAIGMGLNLPIRRVIFTSMTKFDGDRRRELTPQEVKQIGGRAGRYGFGEEGVVALLQGSGSPGLLAKLMQAPPIKQPDLRPMVQPDADIIAAIAAEIGTDSLYGTLGRLRRAVLRPDDPNYRLADLSAQMEAAALLDGAALPLLYRWTYALCPVDLKDHGHQRLKSWAMDHAADRIISPPQAGRLGAPETASKDDLERAERFQKRLVAWRWLAQRFPDIYLDTARAERERHRIDDWIEAVLSHQRRSRPSIHRHAKRRR